MIKLTAPWSIRLVNFAVAGERLPSAVTVRNISFSLSRIVTQATAAPTRFRTLVTIVRSRSCSGSVLDKSCIVSIKRVRPLSLRALPLITCLIIFTWRTEVLKNILLLSSWETTFRLSINESISMSPVQAKPFQVSVWRRSRNVLAPVPLCHLQDDLNLGSHPSWGRSQGDIGAAAQSEQCASHSPDLHPFSARN